MYGDHRTLNVLTQSFPTRRSSDCQRRTSEMVLVHTNVGAPKVERWKYPFVGDEHVTMIERVIIDVPDRKVVRLKMPPDQHRSTLCDDVSCSGGCDRKSTRLNSSHYCASRMPSSA